MKVNPTGFNEQVPEATRVWNETEKRGYQFDLHYQKPLRKVW